MSDRATALWRRMSELFGADAVDRKFGATPPDTWRIAIDRLSDYELERGMRRLVYSGSQFVPSLPEFLRFCREVSNPNFPDEQRRPLPESHRVGGKAWQRWDEQANLHLLGYVTRSEKPYTKSETRHLVAAKHVWAETMRDLEGRGLKPDDNGRELWREAMVNAEAAIAYERVSA